MAKADVEAGKMVIELEESIGNKPVKVSRGAGYDVLVRSKDVEKHIEAKGIRRNDKFFAINGLAGVRNLLFDNNYYIYFCDVSHDVILVTSGDFVIKSMGWSGAEGSKKLVRAWTDTADAIKEVLKIAVVGRITFTLKNPIRTLIQDLQQNPNSVDPSIRDTIKALWKRGKGGWTKIYP